MIRAVVNVLFWLVLGVGCLVFGVAELTGNPLYTWDGTITCDNEVMQPGDVCVETRGSSRTESTYEELLAAQVANDSDPGRPWYSIGAGVVFLLIGAFGIHRLRRRRRVRPAYG